MGTFNKHIDGFVQERHSFSSLAMELRLSYINPSIGFYYKLLIWIIPVQHSQYHGCWWSGSLRRQDISTHDIDYVE